MLFKKSEAEEIENREVLIKGLMKVKVEKKLE